MSAIRLILLLLCVPAMASAAYDAAPWPTPKLVQFADIIVVGVATTERNKTVIHISEVLKGNPLKRIVLSRVNVGIYDEVAIKPGNRGVFLLRKDGLDYAPFALGSYKTVDHLKAVREAIEMVADPGRFLDVSQFPESSDFIYVLAEQFTGWNVTSKEIPSLEWMGPPFYEVAPWKERGVVTLQCAADPQNGFKVRVIAAKPQGALSTCLTHYLLIGYKSPYARRVLKPRFSVTLDARLPERVGTATAKEAMWYLRNRLTSTDSQIVKDALQALARMRDLEAVPQALLLLKHPDEQVRVQAIQFLGWSRDVRAVDPLGVLLKSMAPRYPKAHAISDAAARALGKIGHKKSLPILERASSYGVQRAIEAIGSLGDTSSFETMLTALTENPSTCAPIDFALYWLVRRSNQQTESWMVESSTTQAIQIARIPKWRDWWDAHKQDFKVVESQENVINESIQGN
ncbi:HEAT repeat domain-containing protein [Gimesia algae]|uniref:PBS lyase HEAT-like repeat protein n=1 Tax=Gimesia algae TaxID=2527971 RepID=A0A517V6F9_9PLAN|nr:HEAT repeat domain-containing protein [Gimesia algae]QDT88590.1 PBS lyase HEAT-like repeat protein [Gimesia algae]